MNNLTSTLLIVMTLASCAEKPFVRCEIVSGYCKITSPDCVSYRNIDTKEFTSFDRCDSITQGQKDGVIR